MNNHTTDQVEALRLLTKEIPLNDFGLPTGIYRTDLLPFHDYIPNTHQPEVPEVNTSVLRASIGTDIEGGVIEDALEDAVDLSYPSTGLAMEPYIEPEAVYRIAGFPAEQLHSAFVQLQYDEGFPAFDNGLPFWGRMDFEPSDAFIAFNSYLQMNRGKRSTPGEDMGDEYDGIEATGSRSMALLAAGLATSDAEIPLMIQRLQDYYHMYYWGLRAHSYDLCRVAQHRAQQELRSLETLDDHYTLARRLRHKLEIYMADEDEFWDLMSPKTAIDLLKTTTGLERVSAGMPAGGPSVKPTDSEGRPLEVHLRTIANTNRRPSEDILSEEGAVLDKALEDPESTELLQTLIIKAGG